MIWRKTHSQLLTSKMCHNGSHQYFYPPTGVIMSLFKASEPITCANSVKCPLPPEASYMDCGGRAERRRRSHRPQAQAQPVIASAEKQVFDESRLRNLLCPRSKILFKLLLAAPAKSIEL